MITWTPILLCILVYISFDVPSRRAEVIVTTPLQDHSCNTFIRLRPLRIYGLPPLSDPSDGGVPFTVSTREAMLWCAPREDTKARDGKGANSEPKHQQPR